MSNSKKSPYTGRIHEGVVIGEYAFLMGSFLFIGVSLLCNFILHPPQLVWMGVRLHDPILLEQGTHLLTLFSAWNLSFFFLYCFKREAIAEMEQHIQEKARLKALHPEINWD